MASNVLCSELQLEGQVSSCPVIRVEVDACEVYCLQ